MKRHTISYASLFLFCILMTRCDAPGTAPESMEPVPLLDYEVPAGFPNIVTDNSQYSSSSEKTAYLHIPEGEEAVEFFRIRDMETDRLVYEGRFSETGMTDVLQADFSDLTDSGRYRVECDKYGCSEDFTITEE